MIRVAEAFSHAEQHGCSQCFFKDFYSIYFSQVHTMTMRIKL
jgi:hypothetical protein